MASHEFELTAPPADPGEAEVWLQHAAGFILWEDVRAYAAQRLDTSLDAKAKAAALKAVDDALYGLMMIVDGVSGRLRGGDHEVTLRLVARLKHGAASKQLDLRDGDGMCMGYHGWREGDFGEPPVARRREPSSD